MTTPNAPDNSPSPPPSERERAALYAYWRRNLRIMAALLFLWAFVGLGCGILWADWLNRFSLFGTGYPLGFWFAQQGSILAFILIVLLYTLLMNRADRKHHEERRALAESGGDTGEDDGKGGGQ